MNDFFAFYTEDPLFDRNTFTRSDGSIAARIYERLTKANRRRASKSRARSMVAFESQEAAYRQGVYDTLAALREEIYVY